MLVRASALIVHILTYVSLPEEEVRVREREKTPGGFSLVSVKGNGGWGLRAAREVHHLRAAAASGVSAVMQTRGKMLSSAEESFLMFLFFACDLVNYLSVGDWLDLQSNLKKN